MLPDKKKYSYLQELKKDFAVARAKNEENVARKRICCDWPYSPRRAL